MIGHLFSPHTIMNRIKAIKIIRWFELLGDQQHSSTKKLRAIITCSLPAVLEYYITRSLFFLADHNTIGNKRQAELRLGDLFDLFRCSSSIFSIMS